MLCITFGYTVWICVMLSLSLSYLPEIFSLCIRYQSFFAMSDLIFFGKESKTLFLPKTVKLKVIINQCIKMITLFLILVKLICNINS